MNSSSTVQNSASLPWDLSSKVYIQYISLIQKTIDSLGATVMLGAELEFYLDSDKEIVQEVVASAKKAGLNIVNEKGFNQYEAVFPHTADNAPITIAQNIEAAKVLLQRLCRESKCKLSFEAKPFKDDYGSSLHFHISLHDKDNKALYSIGAIDANKLLLYSIGGLLAISKEATALLCSQEDFKRFRPAFMAPSNLSWGGNNRTTLVRIPDGVNRRIEYRLAPASACPYRLSFVALYGILHGIKAHIDPGQRVWGDASDVQYSLESLPSSVDEARKEYEESSIIKSFIAEYGRLAMLGQS